MGLWAAAIWARKWVDFWAQEPKPGWIALGGGVIKIACLEGLVCFGPNRGQEITFVRTDQWLPPLRQLPSREAQVELLRRYLQAYGPAAPQDFAIWTGMKLKEIAPIWHSLREEMLEVQVGGRTRFLLRKDREAFSSLPHLAEHVRLLPNFDSFLLGHQSKDHLVDQAHYKRIYRKAGWISPVVLFQGRAAGIWSHERKSNRLEITIDSFQKMPPRLRRWIEAEAADLGRFWEVPYLLKFKDSG